MKRLTYLALALWLPLCLARPLDAQSLLFGDCYPVGMTATVTACTDGFTAGIRQPQVLRRPGFPAELTADDSVYTLPAKLDERYAAFAFDAVTATRDGYYAYRYRAINNPDRILTDSVYVRLKRNEQPPLPPADTVLTPPDTIIIPPDTVVTPPEPPAPDTALEPVRLPVPQAVNLVVIDQRGFHRFKVLNADAFTRLNLTLYDRRGMVVLRDEDYQNDYDMSRLPADTYYYRLRAHTPDGSVEKKGFVELVKHER